MEETTAKSSNNRAIVIVLAVIAVLLVAVIAYMAFGNKAADEPAASTDTGTGAPATATFDPATATRVPDGETPETFVAGYFDAIVAGDFQAAYDRLPLDKKTSYGDVATFTSQVQAYGVSGYTMGEITESGDETVVNAAASMPGGNFNYIWTFVKDGDSWLVKSRELGSMQ